MCVHAGEPEVHICHVVILASSLPSNPLILFDFGPCMRRGEPSAQARGHTAVRSPVALQPVPPAGLGWPLCTGFLCGGISVIFIVFIFILLQ